MARPTELLAASCVLAFVCAAEPAPAQTGGAAFDTAATNHATQMLKDGRKIFRFDTFGSEAFWGDTLQLHKAIAGAKNGGVGPGVSPKTALSVGLKVDADALPEAMKNQIKAGKVNLDDPATTIALLKLNAVVGVTAFANPDGSVRSMGIQCAFCHSTVDNSFAPGIGKRLDGWANRDLNVGAIVSLAPNLKPFTDLLGVDTETVKKVLASWGPGRYDAELDKDGKAFRPDGKQAGTLIPPAFGLAGVNLATWTGFGSVTYWNAYVAATQMHGVGDVLRSPLQQQGAVPGVGQERLGQHAQCAGPDDGEAGGAALLPALDPAAESAAPAPSTRPPSSAARRSSPVRESARPATCRRSTPSPDTTCTRRRRSASTPSRPIARRPACIAPRRSPDCGRTRRAASITTAASPRWPMSSTTTTRT